MFSKPIDPREHKPTPSIQREFIRQCRRNGQDLLPPCCRSWAYDPAVHGPSPATQSGHHPDCPEGTGHEMIPTD